MLDELRSYDPLSRDLRDLNNRIVRAVRELTAELGRPPEEIEIARKLEIPVAAFRERLAKLSFGGLVSLDTTGGDGMEGLELGDDQTKVPTASCSAPSDASTSQKRWSDSPSGCRSLLAALLRAGLHAARDWRQLGVTESRACQLHAEAIVRLRAAVQRRRRRAAGRRGDGFGGCTPPKRLGTRMRADETGSPPGLILASKWRGHL